MTELLPFITNQPTASDQGKKDSVFRSAGQTKQYPPRPRITTAKPQASAPASPPKSRGSKSK